jgi:hypothetical protein
LLPPYLSSMPRRAGAEGMITGFQPLLYYENSLYEEVQIQFLYFFYLYFNNHYFL